MAEIKFVKIVVKIGDAELSLSADEARALRDELNKVINEPGWTTIPVWYPSYPAKPWEITYITTTGDNSHA